MSISKLLLGTAVLILSMPALSATYGCKDDAGKLYISKIPCENELLQKNKRKGMNTEELMHLLKVQASLDKSSKKNRKAYMNETGDYVVQGCFSTNQKPKKQGASISYRGYQFQCMKYHKSEIPRFNFYAIDLLKQCRVDASNKFCSGLSKSNKQEMLSQL